MRSQNDADFFRIEIEQIGQRPPRQERRLRARADVEPAGFVQPADRAVGFQVCVLDPLRHIGAFVDRIGRGEASFDIADVAMDLTDNVALRIVDAGFRSLVVNDRGARPHGVFGIENGGQHLVLDRELAAAFLGGGFVVGNHAGDALADEAHDPVQHRGIVGIDDGVLVPGGRVKLCRCILVAQNRAHARNGESFVGADRCDARMCVRRPQQLQMQKPGRREVHGVASGAADDGAGRRRLDVAAAGRSGFGFFDLAHAADGAFDGAVAGAAANVAFQGPFKIVLLRLVEACGRHDHARRAEAALEPLRLQEGFLHRMQFAVARQSFDGGDGAARGPISGKQAGMHRVAIDHHGARAAIAGVATFLHAEISQLAQKCAQALAGPRLRRMALAVDQKSHGALAAFFASSPRTSSANCSVTCRRQAGVPCISL